MHGSLPRPQYIVVGLALLGVSLLAANHRSLERVFGGGGGRTAAGSAGLDLVVFMPTFYPSITDVRFAVFQHTLAEAARNNIRVVVVDASPDPEVRATIAATGATVHQQVPGGGKGAALREALAAAIALPGVRDTTLMCFQEPEKAGMIASWPGVLATADRDRVDVVMPARSAEQWAASYPVEQWHSEHFANALLSAAAAAAGLLLTAPRPGELPFDWTFGPVAFRRRHAHYWLDHTGKVWDAQMMPMLHALKAGLTVSSATVLYTAPAAMKEQEERSLRFIKKRLMQINALAPRFDDEIKLLAGG